MAAACLAIRCLKKFHPKLRNHGEGPGRGLLRDYECCVCQYFRAVEVRIRDVYIWPRDPGHLRLSSLVTAAQAGESWKTILVSIPSALSLGDTHHSLNILTSNQAKNGVLKPLKGIFSQSNLLTDVSSQ